MLRIEDFIYSCCGFPSLPAKDRTAIARAFVAKMVYNMATTRILLERLQTDISLSRICGWERVNDIPEEWTFSRAFAEFSKSQLPERVHEAFIKKHYSGEIVGHNSRDSTAINAREKPIKKENVEKPAKKRGHPKKGDVRVKELTRIEKQAEGMDLPDMLQDLPKACDVGTKKNIVSRQLRWPVESGCCFMTVFCIFSSPIQLRACHKTSVALTGLFARLLRCDNGYIARLCAHYRALKAKKNPT